MHAKCMLYACHTVCLMHSGCMPCCCPWALGQVFHSEAASSCKSSELLSTPWAETAATFWGSVPLYPRPPPAFPPSLLNCSQTGSLLHCQFLGCVMLSVLQPWKLVAHACFFEQVALMAAVSCCPHGVQCGGQLAGLTIDVTLGLPPHPR